MIELYRALGFELIRSFSVMRLNPRLAPPSARVRGRVELKRIDPLGKEEDLVLLNRLHNEAFAEHFDFRPMSVEEVRARLSHEGYEHYVAVAYLGGEPAGYAVASISKRSRELSPKRGVVNSIGVLKPFRRREIGTALLLDAIEWLESKGAGVVELSVDDENLTGAKSLYESVGLRRAFGFLVLRKVL